MNTNSYIRLKNSGFEPKNVLDLGAYKGEWSMNIRHVFSNLFIISVDANKYYDNIPSSDLSFFEVLWNVDDEDIPFYKTNHTFCVGTGDSVFRENTNYYDDNNIVVEYRKTKTVNSILRDLSIEKIDLVKIDTQGSELKILEGFGKFLNEVQVVQLECSLIDYNLGGCKVNEIINFMYENNFIIFDIVEEHRDNSQNLFQVDILFKKK